MIVVNIQMSSTTMELLPLVCLYLLSQFGTTFADGNDPAVINMMVKEGSDAILPCSLSSNEDIESKLFDWKKDGQKEVFMYDAGHHYNNERSGQDEQFKARVSHFPEQLKFGNASIIIRKTKVIDGGDYTCDFPRLQPIRQSRISLLVDPILTSRSEIPGAASVPSVTSLKQTKHWALLQCFVRGAFPKPHIEWQDSSGNVLPAKEPQVTEREGSYDVILQTTVTKTDNYHCVATQEKIKHKVHAEIHMYINGDEKSAGSSSKVIVPSVIRVVLFLALLVTVG